MQLGSMFISNCNNTAVTNKHTAKLHHVGSLYILTFLMSNISAGKMTLYCGQHLDSHSYQKNRSTAVQFISVQHE